LLRKAIIGRHRVKPDAARSVHLDCSGEPQIADLSDNAVDSCVVDREAEIAHPV
jgi:hypothetical protein